MVRKPRKNAIFRGKLRFFVENRDCLLGPSPFLRQSWTRKTRFSTCATAKPSVAHKGAKSKKCAKSENALNKNALSGALNDKLKVLNKIKNMQNIFFVAVCIHFHAGIVCHGHGGVRELGGPAHYHKRKNIWKEKNLQKLCFLNAKLCFS